jgi:predicted XRE-type DNA-binding protein
MRNGTQLKNKRTAARRSPKIEASSGNVFADLRVPNPSEARAKAKLAGRICEVLASRRLTQTQAASVLDIDQPKVSALIRGRLNGFSTDRLIRFLSKLGHDVEILIRPKN